MLIYLGWNSLPHESGALRSVLRNRMPLYLQITRNRKITPGSVRGRAVRGESQRHLLPICPVCRRVSISPLWRASWVGSMTKPTGCWARRQDGPRRWVGGEVVLGEWRRRGPHLTARSQALSWPQQQSTLTYSSVTYISMTSFAPGCWFVTPPVFTRMTNSGA